MLDDSTELVLYFEKFSTTVSVEFFEGLSFILGEIVMCASQLGAIGIRLRNVHNEVKFSLCFSLDTGQLSDAYIS